MVTNSDIQAARERIRGIAQITPVLTSRSFNSEAGMEVFFKCENLQLGGAFKIRGAANFVNSIAKEKLRQGVVAFSSGNHAQAVAIAAKRAGTHATVVMPLDAPKAKADATAAYGAHIVRYNRFTEDREALARKVSEETGAETVPPFDHPLIIAGQGTAAAELLEQVTNLDALITPVGGGGLLSGTAITAKAFNPGLRIFGAEPTLANDTFLSFQKGSIVSIPVPETIADGLRAPSPGKLTFPIIQQNVEQIILVTEEEILAAMKFLLVRLKILVEPSGAVPAAAVLFRKLPAGIGKVGVILSGGNVDFPLPF